MLRHSGLVLAVVLVGLLPSGSRADPLEGQPIYAQNNSNRTIWVAARFIPPGSTSYVNDGYWKVEPGERVLILYNNGVILYLHAHHADGTVSRGNGNATTQTIRGKTVDLYPHDTGTDYNPRTISFFTP
jgi:hypothetical protein